MRNFMAVLIVAVFSTTCGCSSKPAKVQNTPIKTQKKALNNSNDETSAPDKSSNALNQEELDEIRLSGSSICFPSKIRILELQKEEVLREIQIDSNLSDDAVRDLIALHDRFSDLDGEPSKRARKDNCPEGTKPATAVASISYKQAPTNLKTTLRTDNTTSIFSAVTRVTPDLFEKLANVLTLLKEQEGYQLRISGEDETEYRNIDTINQVSGPAKESESYLQIMIDLKF